MRALFSILLNLLIFFFIISIFDSAFSITSEDTIINKVFVGLIFSISMAVVPNILKFFKLPVNSASQFLVAFLLSFIFYFISLYVLNLIYINPTTVNLGIPFISPIELKDRTVALVFLSIISSVLSVGMEELSKKR